MVREGLKFEVSLLLRRDEYLVWWRLVGCGVLSRDFIGGFRGDVRGTNFVAL